MNESPISFPGSAEIWNGYKLYRFQLGACACTAIVPSCPRPGKQWLWRAKFFNAFPNFDLDMVRKGFYLLHIDVAKCASPDQAVEAMSHFYAFLTGEYGMSSKVLMEAYSTGAISAMKWACRNPQNTAGIMLDNPVMEEQYWMVSAEQPFAASEDNPENGTLQAETFRPLAEEHVPVRVIYGTEDVFCNVCRTVPWFIRSYRDIGGRIECAAVPGSSHGPHCLENPESALQFAENCFHTASEQ